MPFPASRQLASTRRVSRQTGELRSYGGAVMPNWGPSWWGRLFTRSADWRLQVDAESVRVIQGSNVQEFELGDRVIHVEEGA